MDNTGPTDQSLRQFPYKIILSIEDFFFWLELLKGLFHNDCQQFETNY